MEIADLDDDTLPDILVCDAPGNSVSWIRQFPAGVYTDAPDQPQDSRAERLEPRRCARSRGSPTCGPVISTATAISISPSRALDMTRETLWLENVGRWQFKPYELQRVSGPINAIVVDLNGDGLCATKVTLVSQEWTRSGRHQHRQAAARREAAVGSTNADFGSSWSSRRRLSSARALVAAWRAVMQGCALRIR